jgi:hypothetical protein
VKTAEDLVYQRQCVSLRHTVLRSYYRSQTRDERRGTKQEQEHGKTAFESAAEDLANCVYERFEMATKFFAGGREVGQMAVQLYSAPINIARSKAPNFLGIPILPSPAELQLPHHFL